jgi:hypothetical protein
MTIHARNDVASVTISESHGGCGQTHSRPVVDGAPVKNWALTCPRCEGHLRFDPQWSPQLDSVPETPDEITAREEKQKRTDVDTQRMMAQAVSSLPEILSQMVAGNAELVKQFIQLASEKGTLPQELQKAPAVKGEVVSRAREVEAPTLSALSINELRAMAKSRGIPIPADKRDKASLVDLLKGN